MAEKIQKRYLVGITGNIGSGKSTVAHLMEEFGAIRISADEIAKRFTDPDSPIKGELKDIFGDAIFDSDFSPIKSKIAELAFNDKSKLEAMNALIHPLVRKEFLAQVSATPPGSVIAWEAPLLFETDAYTLCDAKVCVYLAPERAWDRVEKRGGMSRVDFDKRNLAQLDLEKKKSLSDFIIPNDNSTEELRKKTKKVFERIRNQAQGLI
jgi:dephospho-CoA kinase